MGCSYQWCCTKDLTCIMNKEEAIKIIEQAINAATLKGIYSLEDMKLIVKALAIIK